jgi:hypothetical protein
MNELADIVIGQLMPILISWLKSNKMPDAWKVVLSLAASIAVGAVKTLIAAYLTGTPITLQSLLGSIGIIMTSATVAYKTWFEHTPLNERLEEKRVLP